MKSNKKGFTLIELLVVVLIIGILAAIALPQYHLAVAKSRLSAVIPTVKAMKNAAERYYLIYGQYIGNRGMFMDMDFPGCTETSDKLLCGNTAYDVHTASAYNGQWDVAGLIIRGGDIINSYGIVLDMAIGGGTVYCGAKPDDDIANKVCINMGGKFVRDAMCAHDYTGGSKNCKIYKL
ncbi:MAG: prepilin-type N-terminal cleavage/methylation domain-containing protein [Elusimicrobiota bacterium]|jgi:type IV pilus assembly protein PilE|nr:prepilin-type N-terminal cleavage/methylation domain-containing protein [Elusimicrobiota bacterium]